MWKVYRAFAPASAKRRRCERSEPGPLASLARDYAALDVIAWPAVRRRPNPAEFEAR
jgi:hypothetical protein